MNQDKIKWFAQVNQKSKINFDSWDESKSFFHYWFWFILIHFRSERIAMIRFDSLWFSILIRFDSPEKNKQWPYIGFNYKIKFFASRIRSDKLDYMFYNHRFIDFQFFDLFFWKTGWLEIVRRLWRSWVKGNLPMLTPIFLFTHTFGDYHY